MTTVLTVILGLCMLATLAVMLAGMLGMARSDTDASRSNVLMRWRVVLQGVTLALFALLLLMSRR